jgi:hypothetical protein
MSPVTFLGYIIIAGKQHEYWANTIYSKRIIFYGSLHPLRACLVLPQSIWIEGVLFPSKSKSLSININPFQSIWIENNRFYPNPYGLRGIEEVSIPSKSKSLPIRINPIQSIWIENNRTSPQGNLREHFPHSKEIIGNCLLSEERGAGGIICILTVYV